MAREIFSLLYTKKRMDGTDVKQGKGDRVWGEPGGGMRGLTAAVKAGNAGFRIES